MYLYFVKVSLCLYIFDIHNIADLYSYHEYIYQANDSLRIPRTLLYMITLGKASWLILIFPIARINLNSWLTNVLNLFRFRFIEKRNIRK